MILPCIDLMDGKVVQLVQGRHKALEGDSPFATLERFAEFPEVQVIDLDAALGRGSNLPLVEQLAERTAIRAGGGIRSVERAAQLVQKGVRKVIIGTAAFREQGLNVPFLEALKQAIGKEKVVIALDSSGGSIVVKGWQTATTLRAEDVVHDLEPYCGGFLCTDVDREGLMQGANLEWFHGLRKATAHELTAAGGITHMEEIRELSRLGIHCAVGMAIYVGRLDLMALRTL